MNWNYSQPVPVIFGCGTLARLAEEVKKLGGHKGLLVTSRSFVKRGVAAKIQSECEGLLPLVYGEVSPNPDVKECAACIRLLRENKCDFLVALGGGSVMDCAKAASVVCLTSNTVNDYMEGRVFLPEETEHLPLIAVPTTAGTASEVTRVSVMSDHEKGLKKPLKSNAFYPVLAIVDPELTYSVPPHTTACTGLDVLCHSVEGYWNRNHQPVCDVMAVAALKLVFANLKKACLEPENYEARQNMAQASVFAGLAFNLPGTNCSHVCSYPLTGIYNMPHGEACAMTIDHFMRYNAAHETDGRIEKLARDVGFACANEMADAIAQLKKDIGAACDLKRFNLTDDQIEELVQAGLAPNMKMNPVDIDAAMLREMFNKLR